MRKISVLAFALFTISVSFSQTSDSLMIRQIADEILVNSKAYDNLTHLTKRIGARLSGSASVGPV